MIKRIWVLLSFTVLMCAHQDSEYITEIKKHQEDLNQQFLDPQRSPLSQEDRERFEGHDFFPIDQSFAVNANVERTPESRPFQMAMSSGAPQLYKRIAILIFELKGEK